MFGRGREAVNLNRPKESTISPRLPPPAALPLVTLSAGLSAFARFGFWCVPARCIACGADGDLGAIDLCADCLATFPQRVASAVSVPPVLQGLTVRVPFDYREPLAGALRALKFQGDLRAARVLGALLAAHVASEPRACWPHGIVPVALHADRRRERGFDQAQLLAQRTGAWLHLPVFPWLHRTRITQAQSGLDAAARAKNMVRAFVVNAAGLRSLATQRARCATLRIALLDDVLTTGATLAAARDALLIAADAYGVSIDIQIWAIAATPKSSTMPQNTTAPT